MQPSNTGSWRQAIPYAALSLPVAAAAIIVKHRLLSLGGYLVVARGLGRAGEGDLELLERLSLMREDLLLVLIILPLSFMLVALCSPARLRRPVTAALAAALVLLLAVQYGAVSATGAFLHARMLVTAARFAVEHPRYTLEYVPLTGITGLVALGAVLWLLARWAERRPTVSGRWMGGAAALVAVPVIAAWAPRIGRTGFHAASLTGALSSLWSSPQLDQGAYQGLTADSLVSVYRALTRGAPRTGPGPLTGRARDHDIILLVMESVPARCLDLTGPLTDLPQLQRLRERALVATRHHTTYPYTSFALFSLLTSWYPSPSPRSFVHRYAGAPLPGLMWALRRQGYRAVVYAPDRSSFERDELMYSMAGVERQGLDERRLGRQDVEVLDRKALGALLVDINRWTAAGRRYAIGFFPQTTHGPWKGEGSEAPAARCRRLVRRVDGYLGEVLDTLVRTGRLERTLILITADHGVRTLQEDPDFRTGALDAYSYHVPLMLYAPGVVERTVWLRHLTSHLDAGPTILDLLGITEGRAYELGITMDDPRAANRVVFLLGAGFLGTDGYHDNGRFVAMNHVTNTLYLARDSLSFTAEDVVATSAHATRDSLLRPLRQLFALQEALAARVLEGRFTPPDTPR